MISVSQPCVGVAFIELFLCGFPMNDRPHGGKYTAERLMHRLALFPVTDLPQLHRMPCGAPLPPYPAPYSPE